MKVKVTDPCYVIDTDAWHEICDKADTMQGDWSENFDRLTTNYLKEKSGVSWAIAGETGYGDWSNNMTGDPVVQGQFYADAGMWCVVPAEFDERGESLGGAILEFDDLTQIEVTILNDNNREWTEFEVSGFRGGKISHAYSTPYRTEWEIEDE